MPCSFMNFSMNDPSLAKLLRDPSGAGLESPPAEVFSCWRSVEGRPRFTSGPCLSRLK